MIREKLAKRFDIFFGLSVFLKTYLHNFGIQRCTNFILGKHVPLGNDNKLYNLLVWKCCNHDNRGIHLKLCFLKLFGSNFTFGR